MFDKCTLQFVLSKYETRLLHYLRTVYH